MESSQPDVGASDTSSLAILYSLGPDDERNERKQMLDELQAFLLSKGIPIVKVPTMGGHPLDLYLLFRHVVARGGVLKVILTKLWREIREALCLPSSITSAAYTMRAQYMRYLYDFECHKHAFSRRCEVDQAIERNQREGRSQSNTSYNKVFLSNPGPCVVHPAFSVPASLRGYYHHSAFQPQVPSGLWPYGHMAMGGSLSSILPAAGTPPGFSLKEIEDGGSQQYRKRRRITEDQHILDQMTDDNWPTAEKYLMTAENNQTTPEKNRSTKEKNSATPKKNESTPAKNRATPAKNWATPEKNQATPEKSQVIPATPAKNWATPEKNRANPEKNQAPEKNRANTEKNRANTEKKQSPEKNQTNPKNQAPEKNWASPEKNWATPKKNLAPEKNLATPEKNLATPEKNRATPEKNQATPVTLEKNGAAPVTLEKNGAAPENNWAAPGKSQTTSQKNWATPQKNGLTAENNQPTTQSLLTKHRPPPGAKQENFSVTLTGWETNDDDDESLIVRVSYNGIKYQGILHRETDDEDNRTNDSNRATAKEAGYHSFHHHS